MWPPVRERVSVSYICVAQYSPDHKALTCKRYNCVKSRVSNERREANIMSNFLAFENWLSHVSARLRHLQCVCDWDTELSWAINLAKLCSRNGLLAVWGQLNTEPSVHLCRLVLSFHQGYLVAFNLISLEMQNIITEVWPRQNDHHFADDIFKCIFFNQNICNISPNYITHVLKNVKWYVVYRY